MRDPKRIKQLLNRIESIWKVYPDLRFSQLLMNVFSIEGNPQFYYLEDDEFIEVLTQFYSQLNKNTNNKKRRSK